MFFSPERGVRSPVKREGAERYLLLSLVSFAASVVLTRTFLELTGYPQLGNSELHIAHVLWGGLFLFIASLMPLILSNRWAFNASAILSGVGVGLFIDEVGKFITQNNDYFYPPAAPIIYAFFLLTVLLYLRVRRPSARTARDELYRALEGMTEVLDHDLDPSEHAALRSRLEHIRAETHDENLKCLVDALVDFLREERLKLANPPEKTFFQRMGLHVSHMYERHVSQRRLKYFLVAALAAMGAMALFEFVYLAAVYMQLRPVMRNTLDPLITSGELRSASEAAWFFARTFLEGGTGVLLFVSAGLLTTRRERTGIQLASMVIIIWLAIINLLAYYFDQFGAVLTTLFQFFVLTALTYYRRKYLAIPPAVLPPAPSEALEAVEEEESQL